MIKMFMFLFFFCSLGTGAQVHHPEVVFVPGAHFNAASFFHLMRHFPQGTFLNLPKHTRYPSPTWYRSRSLRLYAKAVCGSIKGTSAVLVGHSMGGAVINEALGVCPEKIGALVYLAATIPFPGETAFELFEDRDDRYYLKAVREDEDYDLFRVRDEKAFIEGFIQDGNPASQEEVRRVTMSEPVAPTKNLLDFPLMGLALPKLVILTTEDRIISPETQMKYARRLPDAQIQQIRSGHLPMLTRTDELARLIKGFLHSRAARSNR